MAGQLSTLDQSVCERIPEFARADSELLRDVVQVLRYRPDIPHGVLVTAEAGVITLTGRVAWHYQKDAAQRAVESVRAVRSVRNELETISSVAARDVQWHIMDTIRRHARLRTYWIYVRTEGRTVILSGSVPSDVEKNEAARAAWRVPGVEEVRNDLVIVA